VQTALGKRRSAWDDIPIVLGDATEPESLHAIAEDTRVVCTTVGPYTTYGTPLVEACIAAETDYCDLTGEVNWVREMIDRYHDDAVEAGTRIVHSCGFDSIPSDLGTKLVQSFAIDEFGTPCDMAHIYLEDSRGSVSGGTMASAIEVFRAASTDPLAQQTLRNPTRWHRKVSVTASIRAHSPDRKGPPPIGVDGSVADGDDERTGRSTQQRAARVSVGA